MNNIVHIFICNFKCNSLKTPGFSPLTFTDLDIISLWLICWVLLYQWVQRYSRCLCSFLCLFLRACVRVCVCTLSDLVLSSCGTVWRILSTQGECLSKSSPAPDAHTHTKVQNLQESDFYLALFNPRDTTKATSLWKPSREDQRLLIHIPPATTLNSPSQYCVNCLGHHQNNSDPLLEPVAEDVLWWPTPGRSESYGLRYRVLWMGLKIWGIWRLSQHWGLCHVPEVFVYWQDYYCPTRTGCARSAAMFMWVVCFNEHTNECLDPRFPSRTMHRK